MALSRSDETDILASLHAGPLEAAPWQTFLPRLRKRLGADQVGLVIQAQDAPLQEWFAGPSPRSEAQRRMIELFGPADPLRLRQLRAERVYGLSDLLDPGDATHVGVRRDLLMPAGESQMRILRVTEPGGTIAWLRAARAGADFGAATASVLSSLAPHLAIALQGFAWAARVRRQAMMSDRLEHLAGLGWISFDPGGRVLDLTPGARHLLLQVPGARISLGERLALPDPGASRALVQVVEAAGHRGETGAMVLATRPRIELRILADAPLLPSGEPRVFGLLRQGDGPEAEAMVQPLTQLYGLSRSEARLAAALAAGSSLTEAAADLALTIQTARTYSKRVFDKTSTRGQADLVRLVLTGVSVLA